MNFMRSGTGVSVLALAALAAGYFGGRPLLEHVEFDRAQADVAMTRSELSTIQDLSTVFRHVGEVVEPSVVNIQVRKTVKENNDMDQSDQLRRFFQEHGLGDMPFDFNFGNGEHPMEEIGTGSGVIMDAGNGYGYVLTNNHVAGGATRIEVDLSDGRRIQGHDVTLIGADPKSDLAVLKIKADRLIPATWGNSDELEKGDWIMAFGSPFGYVGSMTHGIVSALNRNKVVLPNGNDYENFIQVDAPINPGNSGGPLVNIRGEVVGINTAIATVSGGFQGIGFAIPSNEAKLVYNDLKEHGKVVRGWLGIGIADIADDPDTVRYFGYQGTTGVLVEESLPDSPATGILQKGDVITSFNGQPVTDTAQLRNLVAETAPGTEVRLRIFRDQKEQDVTIKLGVQPADLMAMRGQGGEQENGGAEGESQTPEALGMTLQTLTSDTAQSLGIGDVKSGAVISDVADGSIAAQAGLHQGDVITEVGRTPIHNAQEAADALKKVDLSKGVPLYIVSREGSEFVFLKSSDANQ